MSHIVQVSSGLRHTAMVTSGGHVYICGRGNKGQLGVLTPDGKVPTKDMDSLIRGLFHFLHFYRVRKAR